MTTVKLPTILSIDTSCDDTSAAVTRGLMVMSNVIASQTQLHKEYGGVFPTVAKQAHKENIEATVSLALRRIKVDWQQIDAVAVTQGPGLAPALEVGISYAKKLAKEHQKPLIAVNHIEGHILSAIAKRNSNTQFPISKQISSIQYPISKSVLSLVISGGHSEFILVKKIGEYERLGWTLDDAAGECLDKIGRMLGLGYPAGPVLEQFAKKGDASSFEFPLPMTESQDFNLSFSGLKTFSRNKIAELEAAGKLDKQTVYDFAASFQQAVFRHICYKLKKVLQAHPEIESVWLGGGVAVNMELRKMIRKELKSQNQKSKIFNSGFWILNLRVPYSKRLCADNAAMIGIVAGFKFEKGEFANVDNLDRKPRWKITD